MSRRTFTLQRFEDISGVSGIGEVAEGCVFSDGTAVLRWCGDCASTVVHHDLASLLEIHGHAGSTRVRWDDEPDSAGLMRMLRVIPGRWT